MSEASRQLMWHSNSYEVEYIGAVKDAAIDIDMHLSPNDKVEFDFRVMNNIAGQYAIVFGGNDPSPNCWWFQCGCGAGSYAFFKQHGSRSSISGQQKDDGWFSVVGQYKETTANQHPSYVLGQYDSSFDVAQWTAREMQVKEIKWTHLGEVLTFKPYVIKSIPCLWCPERGIAYSSFGELYAGKKI